MAAISKHQLAPKPNELFTCPLDRLPYEIIQIILTFVDDKTLSVFSSLNRSCVGHSEDAYRKRFYLERTFKRLSPKYAQRCVDLKKDFIESENPLRSKFKLLYYAFKLTHDQNLSCSRLNLYPYLVENPDKPFDPRFKKLHEQLQTRHNPKELSKMISTWLEQDESPRALCEITNIEVNGSLGIRAMCLKVLPEEVKFCKKLESLILMMHELTHLPDIFENFPNLTRVNFCQNPLEELPPSFDTCRLIRSLNLFDTQISSQRLEQYLIACFASETCHLKELVIDKTQFDGLSKEIQNKLFLHLDHMRLRLSAVDFFSYFEKTSPPGSTEEFCKYELTKIIPADPSLIKLVSLEAFLIIGHRVARYKGLSK